MSSRRLDAAKVSIQITRDEQSNTYAIMYMQTTIARGAVESVLVAVRNMLLRLRVAIFFAETKVDEQYSATVLALAKQEVARLQVAMNNIL